MPSNGIAGSNGIFISRFLRTHHTIFHNGWTNLHSHQWCKSVSISPHPLQHLLSPDILMIAILTGVRRYLNVVSICISLMTGDNEHFLCLLASCMPSFVKCLFISLAHIWMGLFVFSCKSVLDLCRFWILALCQMGRLQTVFPILVVADFPILVVADCFFCWSEALEFN